MRAPVYFDNAATTYPKPESVRRAVQTALRFSGGNPGRGGHPLAQRAGETVYQTRAAIAEFFGAAPEHVIFTANCTHALNLAIWGTLKAGDHVIISSMEHNSAARPVAELAARGVITYSVAQVSADAEQTVSAFARLIRSNTRAVICTLVSNVTGQILPYKAIGALCRERGLIFIADGAQGCGVLPVTLRDGMHLLCTAGHKGLYGIMGTGLLITDGTVPLTPLMQGGTGSLSSALTQPDFLPDALEAGTVNVPGIAAMGAGLRFVQGQGFDRIFSHEAALCTRAIEGLSAIPGIQIYRERGAAYAPLVSFTHSSTASDVIAERLAEQGYCVRAGLHCAPLAHQTIGTAQTGTVRFAPSVLNTAQETDSFVQAVRRAVR